MIRILEIFRKVDFIEKLMLLIIGALITGIFGPIVISHIDRVKFKEQKLFEAKVARQSEIIKAQTQFISIFSELVWQFQLLAIQISYDALESEEAYESAIRNYNENS